MNMKCKLLGILLAANFLVSQMAQATSYGGYVRNWWAESNGDIMFYFLTQDNSAYVTGLCGSGNYRLQASNGNFDTVYSSLLIAAKNNYKVLMEISSCSSSINIIDIVKVCTWTGDC